jgi:arsenate reductase
MKLSELKNELKKLPNANLRFVLPNGEPIPAHAHVTEVARIEKRFIDCGGTLRNNIHCRLQTWFANDLEHRLTAGKLVKILDMATTVLGPEDMDVDVEHELGVITQFPLASVEIWPSEIVLRLSERHTACLAPDKCLPPPKTTPDLSVLKFDFKQTQPVSACCATQEIQPMKKRVLFVCIHNSARSQMAEAFLNQMCADEFEAHSAGIEPGKLNPIVVEAMREIGIDISGNATKSVSEFLKSSATFSYIITVCDETSAERCPIFPGAGARLHWGFPDPSGLQGTPAEKLEETRKIRDAIKTRIEEWCGEMCGQAFEVPLL